MTRSASASARSAPAQARRSVLVVDDNEINRRVVARQLDVLGHRSVLAETVEEALAALSRERFDLLITDLQMPGMNGIELAKRACAMTHPAATRMPVVLMTAHADAGGLAETHGSSFDAVLVKPTGLDALSACLDRLLPERVSTVAPSHDGRGSSEAFDFAHLDALSEQGVDIDKLLRDWRGSMDEDLARLQGCRDARDIDGLRASLHRLGGAVGLVGAGALMEALQRARSARPLPTPQTLDGLVERMRTLMMRLGDAARWYGNTTLARKP